MSIDLRTIALNIIDRNPNIARDPKNKEMIDALRSGDSQRGQALANNFCAAYGKTPQQAEQEAKNFFKLNN